MAQPFRRGPNCRRILSRLKSLETKLEIGEISVWDLEFTKSTAGYEFEFRGRRFRFDEDAHEKNIIEDHTPGDYSWEAKAIPVGVSQVVPLWRDIASVTPSLPAKEWEAFGRTKGGVYWLRSSRHSLHPGAGFIARARPTECESAVK